MYAATILTVAMKTIVTISFILCSGFVFSQTDDSQAIIKGIEAFQQEANKFYKDPSESPLEPKQRKKFKGHEFFSINLKYYVKARFTKFETPTFFKMKTTTQRLPEYSTYGEAVFEIDGKEYTLVLYRSAETSAKDEYKDYLFLPFTDLTNGKQTYAGGRFIDLKIPTDDFIIIDFNKAYNPYCAYNHKYSCPVPPAENHLNVEILAGVKAGHK